MNPIHSCLLKSIKRAGIPALALFLATGLRADLVGPYTPDAHTLFLFHFDEAPGGAVTANVGSKGGNAYSVDANPIAALPPPVTTMLGAAGFSSGAINFGNCMTNPASSAAQEGFLFGYDYDNSGAFDADVSGATQSADRLGMTNLNMGNGGQSSFTLEALIRPTSTAGSQEIICTDNSQGNAARGFQFRINSGGLQLQWIGGASPTAVSGTIPTTGPDAFVPGEWYHVAAVYDGTTVTLYWTRLDPANGAAHVLSSGAMAIGTVRGAVVGPLVFGNDNRNAAGEQFLGSIDEIRISSVARAANQMQFFSPLVTITQSPVSQNVDYNQPVTFSVSASSLTPLSYQWRFNSNSISGATAAGYTITNVAAANAGYYDVVVTNTAGYAATSSPALLVVGAANFLAHRYSFATDASDSVGGAHGTNMGNAQVAGGALVLDGTPGTYVELPGGLFNAQNANALTVEFWASFGANANFARVFDFGNTNVQNNGVNYIGFSPRNGTAGHQLHVSPGDGTFQQQVTAPGILDGLSVHIACVFDPASQSIAIYTNGALEAVNTNMTVGIANLNNALSFIGRSLFGADPYLNGSIDELRIFRGALSPITIQQSELQGPNSLLADGPVEFLTGPTNTSVPLGQTVTFHAAAVGYLPITYQWFKNGQPIADATNASYTFAPVSGDDNATIQVWATNVIGVTTYTDSSTTATLDVFVPPTLAWLDLSTGAQDSDWNLASLNWTNTVGGGPLAFSSGAAVVFDSRGSGAPTVNLSQAVNPSRITVSAASDYLLTSFGLNGSLIGQGGITKQGSGKLTIDVTNNLTGGILITGGTLQIGNGGTTGTPGNGNITNNGTLAFNRADGLVVGNVISGTGAVQVDGGSVTLSGVNEYSGQTRINAGVVYLPNAAGLGTAGGGTLVANGGQLYLTGNQPISGESLTLNGVGDNNGALRKGGASLTTFGGAVTLASDTTIGVDGGATIDLAGTVSGAAALTKNGGGTLVLSALNTYDGGTVLDSGVLTYDANGAFGAGGVTTTPTSTGRILLGNGTALSNTITADSINPGAALGFLMKVENTNVPVSTYSGSLTFNADAVSGGHLAGPTGPGYLHMAGPVNLAGAATALSVRLGNVRFSGGGTYPEIQVRADTTSLGTHNGIATSAVMDLAGNGSPTVPTYFDLNGYHQTLAGLKNVVGPANLGIVTNSSAVASTLTLDLAGGSQSFSGNLAGNLALTLVSGTQVLTGTNSYSGDTTINGGLLAIAQPTFSANAAVIITNGAVLQLDFAGTNRIAGLVLNGVSQPFGVYNNATSPLYITGPGSLLVAEPSTATNPTNITGVVNGTRYDLSWPDSHKGWVLQSNSVSVANGAAWFPVANSTATNRMTLNINPALTNVFFRLVLP